MNVWTGYASGVVTVAADIVTDILPIVALLGGIGLAVSLAFVFSRVLRGGR